ncbi:3-hydroxyacyl-CoA dehydrogenase [Sedimentitalea sp. CY04]|uniref:3-hydroxyacyl-CoA dehydrogenase n=2 Tax=Parasedimentitalea TaxID=2738399 RepID=A0A6A4RG72_9RHOB|nr:MULTISPECIES: 3-hydroxyacyl-CoA dehydrogenase [Paracoccaceae]KAE9628009.1 3-hydroxyacyl-CoA dehydrogenase [Zongyanglinia marina]NIZ63210.1 3-hydroxyacyl-CoA dehydrogenase [Sedimentitalea sp. CY04]
MNKIAVVGTGLIGQGWAAVFAQAGFEVALYDASQEAAERALKAMENRIDDLAEFDLIEPSDAPNVLKRITIASRLEDALDGAIYVQENGPEIVDIKRELTQALDALAAKDVPIGSSTSGISASRYCEHIPGRHRCFVVHPINPPHLHPAVEIVPTPWTDQNAISMVNELMIKCGRETIVLSEEIDGFVVNRLQGALLEEAFRLVGRGIVSPEDLDKAICDGLGLRWSIMGPMQTIHLNAPGGVSDYVARYGEMYRGFGIGPYDDVDWASIANEKLEAKMSKRTPVAEIPEAQIARDRKLMALLRHKKQVGVEASKP